MLSSSLLSLGAGNARGVWWPTLDMQEVGAMEVPSWLLV